MTDAQIIAVAFVAALAVQGVVILAIVRSLRGR